MPASSGSGSTHAMGWEGQVQRNTRNAAEEVMPTRPKPAWLGDRDRARWWWWCAWEVLACAWWCKMGVHAVGGWGRGERPAAPCGWHGAPRGGRRWCCCCCPAASGMLAATPPARIPAHLHRRHRAAVQAEGQADGDLQAQRGRGTAGGAQAVHTPHTVWGVVLLNPRPHTIQKVNLATKTMGPANP